MMQIQNEDTLRKIIQRLSTKIADLTFQIAALEVQVLEKQSVVSEKSNDEGKGNEKVHGNTENS